jgi:hypothetical protein
MAKSTKGKTSERPRREEPERAAPNRSGSEHIKRNANSRHGDDRGRDRRVSETVQQAISDMVQVSSNVIEDQIRAGQQAAERLRDGIANSKQLNTDINMLVDSLVAATKDVGATWLDLLSIVTRSIGKPSGPGHGGGGGPTPPPPRPRTVTETGTSGSATTISSITPADPAITGIPPQIVVKGVRVRNVKLDLRPPTAHFVPVLPVLHSGDRRATLTGLKFEPSADRTRLVLTVSVANDQPGGTYSGVIVDSSTNEAGGTVSVTVAG